MARCNQAKPDLKDYEKELPRAGARRCSWVFTSVMEGFTYVDRIKARPSMREIVLKMLGDIGTEPEYLFELGKKPRIGCMSGYFKDSGAPLVCDWG